MNKINWKLSLQKFPAPPEVDRQLYGEVENTFVNIVNGQFPPPREVDRWIYSGAYRNERQVCFSAPPDVNRQLYKFSFVFAALAALLFPAHRQVDRFPYLDEPEKVKIPQFVFSTPRGGILGAIQIARLVGRTSTLMSFRPLPRQIGIYTPIDISDEELPFQFPAHRQVDRGLYPGWVKYCDNWYQFPAPLEVDRQLCFDCPGIEIEEVEWFPASCEVDKQLYPETILKTIVDVVGFPSPLEVDRQLYNKIALVTWKQRLQVSGPSRGRQGAIHGYCLFIMIDIKKFPSPRELNREL